MRCGAVLCARSAAERESMHSIERRDSLKYFKQEAPVVVWAGLATESLSRSQTALDYAPARLEGRRSFLMDDYDMIGRTARRPAPSSDSVAALIGYQALPGDFSQGKGLSNTKFGAGFTRRQQCDIKQDESRTSYEALRTDR